MNNVNAEITAENLIDYLRSKGCSEQMMSAKVIPIIEQGLANGGISSIETAQQSLKRVEDNAQRIDKEINAISCNIKGYEKRYSHIESLLEKYETSVESCIITDEAVMNGINAFTLMLESVRDVFGTNNMTEAVICKAVEAGSYGYWRSVMGPKFKEDKEPNKGYKRIY